jgi:hypothetical protein
VIYSAREINNSKYHIHVHIWCENIARVVRTVTVKYKVSGVNSHEYTDGEMVKRNNSECMQYNDSGEIILTGIYMMYLLTETSTSFPYTLFCMGIITYNI